MKRSLSIIVCIATVVVLLTGCWNRRESNNIEYVLAAGIDMNDRGEVALTIQTPVLEAMKPQAPFGKHEQTKSLSVSGKSTFDAIRSYIDITGIKLFWAHMKVIIIGEAAARYGVDYYLDFFLSDPELRNTAYIAVAKGRAKDILEAHPDISAIPANYLNNLLKSSSLNAKAPEIKFNEFTRKLTQPIGGQPYSPLLILENQSRYDRKSVGIKPYTGGEVEQSPLYSIQGTAIFKDTKMVGQLNKTNSRGLLWVANKVQSASVIVPCRDEQDCHITLEVVGKTKAITKVDVVNNKPVIHIKLKAEVNIADRSSHQVIIKEDYLHYLEEQFAQVVKSEIEVAFQKAVKKYHSDVFGFGNTMEDDHPYKWKSMKDDWEETLLPRAELIVEVDAKIRRVSRNLYSPWVKD